MSSLEHGSEIGREAVATAAVKKAVDALRAIHPDIEIDQYTFEIKEGFAARIGNTGPEIRIKRIGQPSIEIGIEEDGSLTHRGEKLSEGLTNDEKAVLLNMLPPRTKE